MISFTINLEVMSRVGAQRINPFLPNVPFWIKREHWEEKG